MTPHPHDAKNMPALLKKLYWLGWYGGTHDLCTITIEGGFEHTLSSRATESWDLVFRVETKEIKNDSGNIILPSLTVRDETFDGAISKILAQLA